MQVEPDTSPPPALTQQNNSGDFSFVVPTEFVELPSKGLYYPEEHPLHHQESIEIKQMTAKEEDLLTSKTLLKKGIAIDRLIQNLIVDRRIRPDSLLVGDRNALIIAIRKSGYGADYNTQLTCPSCATAQDKSFDLNDFSVYHGDKIDQLKILDQHDGTFLTELPKTKIKVRFQLLTGRHENDLAAGMNHDRKKNQTERIITRQLRSMIVSVNDNSSAEVVNYLIENIPSMDSRHLRLAYKLSAPNIDLTQHFICNECDYEQDLEVPLTADFFWPDR
tara:strand:- start:1274 stop:2104 length:831 start_codon:yes stop_codon:yes gene_type:complete